VRPYLASYRDARWPLVAGILGAVLQTALLLPVPWLVGWAIDDVIPSGDTGELMIVGSLIVGLTLLGAFVALASRSVIVSSTKRATADLRRAVVERIHALPRQAQQRFDVAELHDRLLMATARVDAMAVAVLADLLPGLVLTVGITGLLVVLDWRSPSSPSPSARSSWWRPAWSAVCSNRRTSATTAPTRT
jgi:ABC-type multidrug transport system fused ATPase/permease subunit